MRKLNHEQLTILRNNYLRKSNEEIALMINSTAIEVNKAKIANGYESPRRY